MLYEKITSVLPQCNKIRQLCTTHVANSITNDMI